MKKTILTALLGLTFAASTAFAAVPQQVQLTDGNFNYYSVLNTGSANSLALAVPLADLGGSVPSDLSIAVSGLPAGTTLSMNSVQVFGGDALIWVTAHRANPMQRVAATADIALVSGGQTLASVSVPVVGTVNHSSE